MGLLLRMLMQLLLLVAVIISAVAPAATAAIALPGCVDKCGNVSIPYPFGIEDQPNSNCSRGGSFILTCENSTLTMSDFSVKDISVEENQLKVQLPISKLCFKESASDYTWDIHLANDYTVSDAMNTLVAVGCDTNAYLSGLRNNISFSTGCSSQCGGFETVANGSCFGIGCCQVEIPNDLTNFSVTLFSFYNHTGVLSFNPCSYAFLVEKGKFNFNSGYLANLPYNDLPTVLDWTIRNATCEEAKNKPDYACHGNSECHNVSLGYHCHCKQGYQGNPYHPDGCKDIDECADSKLNNCTISKSCANTIGNYTCSCPKWKHGDGRKYGESCVADISLIMITFGVSTSVGLLFLFIGAWWSYKMIDKRKKIKRKENFFKRNGGLLLQQQLSSSQVNVENTKMYNSKELEEATDHFNVTRILGQGGQGTVYKGMLVDGRIVAVKKSKIIDEGKLEEFINEVVILSQINHRNVVKLLGCCLETEVPLLVYEFIPNGTLYQYLNDQNEEFPLTWDMRLRIAIEIAGALFYLHSAATSPIYHRDIKSTNILLDDKYRAKVADFGTSRSVAIDQTHLTTLVHGTFGYVDPEYFQSGQFSEKSDVYSFGVVLVELLTGQKAISSTRTQEGKSLATYFLLSLKENYLFDILDPRVLKEGGKEQIIRFGNLAKMCLNLNGKKRPTMKEVTMALEAIQMFPKTLTAQQNCEEVEYAKTEIYEAGDATSTSTMSGLDSAEISSLDTQPFLSS